MKKHINPFLGSVVKQKQKNGVVSGLIVYLNSKFFIKVKGRLYKLKDLSIDDAKVLYSLPRNNKREPWSEKTITDENKVWNVDIVSEYWGKYKPGIKLRGYIDDDALFNVIEDD